MQSETGFPSSHQLKSYVASKSRLKLAARAVLSADAGLLVIFVFIINIMSTTPFFIQFIFVIAAFLIPAVAHILSLECFWDSRTNLKLLSYASEIF